MSTGRLRRAATTAFTVLTMIAVAGASAPATAAPASPGGTKPAVESLGIQRYVALGDSYTSGPFIPLPRFDPLGCFKSTRNYPGYLSRKLGLSDYTDASCGGADTGNMTAPQSVPFGANAPQYDALRTDTELVTVGVGGNDFGTFGNLVGTCPTLRASDPTGSPCREHFTVDGVDTIRANMPELGRRVSAVLEGVRARAPQAKVLIIGYPRLVPPQGTCPDVVPFADGDYAWADGIERAMNRQLRRAAALTDATYVDTYTPSLGHDACAGDEAWINGQHTDIFAAISYHPFASYMAAASSLIYDTLAGVTPSPARAAAAARAAEDQVAATDHQVSEDARRAGAAAGITHGGTTAGEVCPTS
ncbi:MAG: SGNH/GDSL hydrolase family protein [Micromonosporaceae bacterium]